MMIKVRINTCLPYLTMFQSYSHFCVAIIRDSFISGEGARNGHPRRFARKLAVVVPKNFAIFQEFQVYVE